MTYLRDEDVNDKVNNNVTITPLAQNTEISKHMKNTVVNRILHGRKEQVALRTNTPLLGMRRQSDKLLY